MKTHHILILTLTILLLAMCGCAQKSAKPSPVQAASSSQAQAVEKQAVQEPLAPAPVAPDAEYLRPAISTLAKRLIESNKISQAGKVAVADFMGPGTGITQLGEHVSDKLGVALFRSGVFQDMMERKQLKQVLQSRKQEMSGYFDQSTVQRFGRMLGVDSMVVGEVQDMGPTYDVTAKLVQSGTGRILSMADVSVIKDASTASMASAKRTGRLSVSINRAEQGTVTVCGRKASLHNGSALFSGLPYGNCNVAVKVPGYDPIHSTVNISSPSDSISLRLPEKTYSASFSISPANAALLVDGKQIPLNKNGFAKLDGLKDKDYPCTIKAKGYGTVTKTFNPKRESNPIIKLTALAPKDKTDWREISDSMEVAKLGYLQVIGVSAPGQSKYAALTAAKYLAAARMLEIMQGLPLERTSVVRSGKMDGDTLKMQLSGMVNQAGSCGEKFDAKTGTGEYCMRRYLRGYGTAMDAVFEAMTGEK